MGEKVMDVLQRGVITLIRASLTGEGLSLPEGFELEAASAIIKSHGVIAMAYDGAVKCGVDKSLPAMKELFQGYVKCMLHSEGQMRMLEKLCGELDAKGFDHLLMKGGIIKKYYPKPELRQMGDADILIRRDDYEAICPLMESLGFRNTAQGHYDYGWKSPELYVELHHQLSNPYNSDFNDYLGDGWPRARKSASGNHRFEYSPEDHFIYVFIHFTKHYRDGGIGLRHAADLWAFRKAEEAMDMDYIEAELDKIGMKLFYKNVMRMLACWFEDGGEDDVTDYIARTVFASGAFGTGEQIRKAVSLRAANKTGSAKSAKVWRVLQMLFPNRIGMQRRYPVLKKYPFLLPLLWPVRIVSGLLFRRENVRLQRQYVRESGADTIESYRQALEFVGLNYTVKD